ncbi:MAG TPA: GGDEF domain-containing protein [Gammaproteobacteria bacterium]
MPQRKDDLSYQCLTTVLDGLDALVYVSDMQSYELLYVNKYGRDIWGSNIQGKTCWQVLQKDQDGPCTFCTNKKLLKKDGTAGDVYVWEFKNTLNNHWYQCRDQAITWIDGRTVRMEIATDITSLKNSEQKLLSAKMLAEERASQDELTNLYNRRAFFEQGKQLFKQARRYQQHVSVMMIDIDHFKNINDNHGHTVGDSVLKTIAGLLQKTIREVDILARIGGEEFAIILPQTGVEEASNLAERIRQCIETEAIQHDTLQINITASFGIAACMVEGDDLDRLLTKADDALYIAKKKGRNQVKTCP